MKYIIVFFWIKSHCHNNQHLVFQTFICTLRTLFIMRDYFLVKRQSFTFFFLTLHVIMYDIK